MAKLTRLGDLERAVMDHLWSAPQPQTPTSAPIPYLSGRWHRRDGDSYGIVQAQPPIVLPEPDSADHPPGDLRSPDQR